MKPDPINALGLFVLRVLRRRTWSGFPLRRMHPLAPSSTDEMEALRRALQRQIERDEARHG